MAKPKDKPNVIWIFGDQHRAQALGCNGDSNLHTPNIDNLAAMGVNFTRAVSGDPLCCPARGAILSSQYPHKCVPGHERQLPPEQLTVAHAFREEGYKTAYIGKWHLDGFREKKDNRAAYHIVPPERRGGFEHWIGYENNNSQWDCWVHGGEGESAFHYRLPGYETDELTNLFVDYIQERGEEQKTGELTPFFSVLSVQPPHNPYIAPSGNLINHSPGDLKLRPNVPNVPWVRDRVKSELYRYNAMIENLDWNVGRIRQALTEAGLAYNTHILFFSDHGDLHGSHGQFYKTSPYEESIRIPLIISGEQPVYEGRKNGNIPVPVNHVDIAPTTLGLCGIDKPAWMEGTDYSHYRLDWRKPDKEMDSAFLQSVIPTGNYDSVDKPWRGIVTKDGWKYICFEGMPWLMFHLNEDPYEQVNLAHSSRYKEKRKSLNDRLTKWIEETGDTFPLPNV